MEILRRSGFHYIPKACLYQESGWTIILTGLDIHPLITDSCFSGVSEREFEVRLSGPSGKRVLGWSERARAETLEALSFELNLRRSKHAAEQTG
jgi:hypothetical protein